MLTNRFLSIPIKILDAEQIEQGLKVIDSLKIIAKINPMSIESYEQAIPEHLAIHPTILTCTNITMKAGHTYLAQMRMEDFECLLNKWSAEG